MRAWRENGQQLKKKKYGELYRLYVQENKTIGEISHILGIAESTVFQRLMRLHIPSTPERKTTYIAKKREGVVISQKYSPQLAEFFGIMPGER